MGRHNEVSCFAGMLENADCSTQQNKHYGAGVGGLRRTAPTDWITRARRAASRGTDKFNDILYAILIEIPFVPVGGTGSDR
jgi:hypothetical protein